LKPRGRRIALIEIDELVKQVLRGDQRCISKTITLIENGSPGAREAIALLHPHTGGAAIIGITGPTGVGKSTLVEKLVKEFRGRGRTVGVVAVDPTSPFSGGAFLGDRVRMQGLSADEGVFIRSMATRGSHGGLPRTLRDVVKVLDAAGKDVVMVETVGAGQSDVEIMRVAETVVVMLSPGLGDEIQALKAGMMEIGDIFVVNKVDRPNADKTVLDIRSILNMKTEELGWRPPVVKTVALSGEGVDELLDEIRRHREHLKSGPLDERRRRKAESEIEEAIRQRATEHILRALKRSGRFEEVVRRILTLEADPYSAVDELLTQMLKS